MWGKTEFVSTGSLRNYNGEPLLARLDARRLLWVTGQHDEARPPPSMISPSAPPAPPSR
jgi:proline iminopeptidase/L-proline amide hydrolase